jgi:small subunit ribosomal protein S6
MAVYDLMLILDAEAPEDRRAEILGGVREAIEADGTLHDVHDWGSRRLAFEIHGRGDGAYHLLQLEGEPALLDRLQRTLKITDGVLRFRFIRLRSGTLPPPPPGAEGQRQGDDEGAEAPALVAARAAADAPARS